jgi:energy-coupling factor transport system ATP-binding protein
MALAETNTLSFTYPEGERPALDCVSLALEPGELVVLLGPSGSGKSTLLRALSGLVPHFHGGRFSGRVEVAGEDTRTARPADLAGTVATLFQDPEDQVVFGRVENEVAFGLENLGVAPREILPRVRVALGAVGAEHLFGRRTETLSAGELQRVCLASALALEPALLLLDEPTSQLDPDAAESLLDLAVRLDVAVVVCEQRPARPLGRCDRVLFLEEGRLVLDASRAQALEWLAAHRPGYLPREPAELGSGTEAGEIVCRLEEVAFAYPGGPPVLDGVDLELARGEIVALTGPNGAGKTTLGKLASGLLAPQRGLARGTGSAAYLLQDPGRYVVTDRVEDEVAVGVRGDLARARRALAAVGLSGLERRHPRDLSSGERERLALAAVLVGDPDVLVLDEPTRGVDPPRKGELAELLHRDAHRRATLLITHDLVFAGEVADRLITLGVHEAVHA